MIIAHFDAVRDRLAAHEDLQNRVHASAMVDGNNKLVRDTYLILFGSVEGMDLDDARLTREYDNTTDVEFVFTVRSVSPTPEGAMRSSGLVFAQLVGFAPVVAGRACRKMQFRSSEPVKPDNEVNPPLFYCEDDFTLYSSRT